MLLFFSNFLYQYVRPKTPYHDSVFGNVRSKNLRFPVFAYYPGMCPPQPDCVAPAYAGG